MLRFITKQELWEAEDAGIGRLVRGRLVDSILRRDGRYNLKVIQDTICLKWLKDAANKTIGEIGGGNPRVLGYLAKKNRCTNIDPFEGVGLGPKSPKKIRNVRNVYASLGDFSKELVDEEFDITFSISVVEHVATDQIDNFFKDCARVTKINGLTVHLIDVYLGDTPEANQNATKRIQKYKESFAIYFLPSDSNQMLDGEMRFSCEYATNPDDAMKKWNEIAPRLEKTRAVSQSCSLIMAGTRR